jgi:predicted nucleic acid-binding protein
MGALTLPQGSVVYLDTSAVIYSVERIEPYAALLLPVWQAASKGEYSFITSALTLLETLVGPFKASDALLEAAYRQLLQQSADLQLIGISDPILERAALLRATIGLRTPDAIHAATALIAGSTHCITNDPAFRRVPNLSVLVLDEYIP